MTDWSARQYLKFEDERTRPARDLLAQVPLAAARRVVDLGCGPGNSTELLAARFAGAEVVGLDSSPDMLRQARARLPALRFVEADLTDWRPEPDTDLLFANAVLQWVPGHAAVLRRLLETLRQGGALAVQMPDNLAEPSHELMRAVAQGGPWASRLAAADEARGGLLTPSGYYDLLKPACRHVDIWHSVYNHVLAGPAAIAEWFQSTALRPYLNQLDAAERERFLEAYVAALAKAYPLQSDGTVLLRFPRLFILAIR